MNIDHITVHLHSTALHSPMLGSLLHDLGFKEVKADPQIEAGWDVRWFEAVGPIPSDTLLHLVADDNWPETPEPGLSHFCLTGVGQGVFDWARRGCEYREHYTPGSQRCWINYHGMRIEVRP